mmetsp:Transcript_36355/g.114366  ORF Transcript_36355/g.114366 Transcript_36355/m.114366 type:complete len:205 (+) Transcript_36355:320-934(+)
MAAAAGAAGFASRAPRLRRARGFAARASSPSSRVGGAGEIVGSTAPACAPACTSLRRRSTKPVESDRCKVAGGMGEGARETSPDSLPQDGSRCAHADASSSPLELEQLLVALAAASAAIAWSEVRGCGRGDGGAGDEAAGGWCELLPRASAHAATGGKSGQPASTVGTSRPTLRNASLMRVFGEPRPSVSSSAAASASSSCRAD